MREGLDKVIAFVINSRRKVKPFQKITNDLQVVDKEKIKAIVQLNRLKITKVWSNTTLICSISR